MFTFTREIFIRTALVIFSFLFSLFVAEAALQLFTPQEHGLKIKEHKILGIKAESGGEWDANGFRNSVVPQDPYMVVMGDSQTRGLNASSEESWPNQLGEIIGEEVYQMAFDRYGPAQYSYLTDQALKEFSPDLIVWGLYLGNDIFDAYDHVYSNDFWEDMRKDEMKGLREKIAEKSEKVNREVREAKNSESFSFKILQVRQWLRSHSKVYALLGNGTRGIREALGFAADKEERRAEKIAWAKNNPDLAFFYQREPHTTILSPAYRYEVVNLKNKATREGWRLTKELIKKNKRRTKEHGVEFAIVVIPTKELVYGNFMQQERKQLSPELADIVERERVLYQTVLDFCNTEEIPCSGVDDELVSAMKQGVKIYPETLDGHPIASGYKVIGRGVRDFLMDSVISQ